MNFLISLLMIVFVSSCAQTSSSDILTNSIYITQTVEADKDLNVTCTAILQVGSAMGTYLELTNGDTVECNGVVMEKSEFLGITSYTANVPYVAQGDYQILFERASDESYESTVTLPAVPVVTSPTDGASFLKGANLSLIWASATGTNIDIRVSYSYATGSSNASESITNSQVTETGNYSFDAETSQITEAGNVDGIVNFRRIKTGTQATGLSGTMKGAVNKEFDIFFID